VFDYIFSFSVFKDLRIINLIVFKIYIEAAINQTPHCRRGQELGHHRPRFEGLGATPGTRAHGQVWFRGQLPPILHYRNHFSDPCTGIHVTVGSANVFKIN